MEYFLHSSYAGLPLSGCGSFAASGDPVIGYSLPVSRTRTAGGGTPVGDGILMEGSRRHPYILAGSTWVRAMTTLDDRQESVEEEFAAVSPLRRPRIPKQAERLMAAAKTHLAYGERNRGGSGSQ